MSVLSIEEQRLKWKRADEDAAETLACSMAALGISPEQCAARQALGFKPETLAERRERESFERTAEISAMRTERTLERRRIAHEEMGEFASYLLGRVIELELERDCAIGLAAKYKGFAAALCRERIRQAERDFGKGK